MGSGSSWFPDKAHGDGVSAAAMSSSSRGLDVHYAAGIILQQGNMVLEVPIWRT